MTKYATLDDLSTLVRPITAAEEAKASALLEAASAILREKARQRGRDLDALIEADDDLAAIARVIVCDMVRRALSVDVTAEPMTQISQSALGYSVSGTYAVPGGGLYVMDNELKRLGLLKQIVTVLEPYGGNEPC